MLINGNGTIGRGNPSPGNADGVISRLDKARFIENKHPFGISQVLGQQPVISGKIRSFPPATSLKKCCMARTLALSAFRAIGSMDFKSSWLIWPVMYI